MYPILPRTGRRVPQINSRLVILKKLFAASVSPRADCSAEVACAWITAEIGFREEEKVDFLRCSGAGGRFEGCERGGEVVEGVRLGERDPEDLRHGGRIGVMVYRRKSLLPSL